MQLMQYTENKEESAMLSPSQVREIAYFLSEAAYKLATDGSANPDKVQGLAVFAIEFNKYAHLSGALDSSTITEG
jgi:hypothetical protein